MMLTICMVLQESRAGAGPHWLAFEDVLPHFQATDFRHQQMDDAWTRFRAQLISKAAAASATSKLNATAQQYAQLQWQGQEAVAKGWRMML